MSPALEFFESSPLAVAAVDAQGVVQLWNPAAQHLLGWPRAEVVGRVLPLFQTDLALGAALDEARAGHPSVSSPRQLERADGSLVFVTISLSALPDGGCLAMFHDHTTPAQTFAALEASERKFRSFFEHAFDAVMLTDGDGRILEANPASTRLLGWSAAELPGMTLRDLVDPSDHGMLHAHALAQGVHRDGQSVGELRLKRKDGMPLLADVSTVALGANHFLGFLRDVTAARTAEQQLKLFAKVFESSGEAVLITDARNSIVTANAAFTQITGYQLDEVQGKNPSVLSSGRHDRSFYAHLWERLGTLGHWQGELWNRRKNGEVYPEWVTINALRDPKGEVSNYIAVFSDITEIKASEARVAWLAHHDSLTGLPNRTLLRDRLTQAIASARRAGEQVAVLLVDLDGFKTINDSIGHHAGDQVLQVIARRLKSRIRQTDTVARMGGDEFIVVLPELALDAAAIGVVSKVISAVSEPIEVGLREINLTTSIGIAVYPADGDDIDSLLRNADAAMYTAKENGRNGYRFFTADMNTRALERLTLLHALRRAVERNEFHVAFQPKFTIGGKVIGAEALIRWDHPEMGAVSPARFIPVAEDSGLIRPIGEWVLRAACEQAKLWVGLGMPLPVAVNVSPVQLQHDLVGVVTRVLADTGLDPALLEIELTESAVMKEVDVSAQALVQLRGLGVHLAIDDFGTGYSSLSQLKRFPIERLKIDRGFVRDVLTDTDDLEIIRAIITLGHSLRLKVIAEGVETGEQLEVLRRLECDEAQGFLLGRPMPPADVERILRAR